MTNKSLSRTINRVKTDKAKELYDLVIEYVYYRSKCQTNKEKKDLFEQYNKLWLDKCFANRNNKYINLNYMGFINIVSNIKQLNKTQKELGLPIEKFTIWQRLFGDKTLKR